eukprot:6087554-Prymnesium_polylepis.1
MAYSYRHAGRRHQHRLQRSCDVRVSCQLRGHPARYERSPQVPGDRYLSWVLIHVYTTRPHPRSQTYVSCRGAIETKAAPVPPPSLVVVWTACVVRPKIVWTPTSCHKLTRATATTIWCSSQRSRACDQSTRCGSWVNDSTAPDASR